MNLLPFFTPQKLKQKAIEWQALTKECKKTGGVNTGVQMKLDVFCHRYNERISSSKLLSIVFPK